MIICKEFPNQEFADKQEMFKALIDNKKSILTLKKSAIKETDGFSFGYVETTDKSDVIVKANKPVVDENISEVKVKVVINTIGLFDSHRDVHIKGIWKRSLEHSDIKMHLQEHNKTFNSVITNEAKAYTRSVAWKTLGAPYEGNTEALIFESTVKASRNEEMFKQYKMGWVNNHSAGMQYVEMKFCVNSDAEWATDEKANWDKYYPMVANKEDLDQVGYFYAVTEAKLIEGSAVLFGSNFITPTLENNMKSADDAPLDIDKEDPAIATQKDENEIIVKRRRQI